MRAARPMIADLTMQCYGEILHRIVADASASNTRTQEQAKDRSLVGCRY